MIAPNNVGNTPNLDPADPNINFTYEKNQGKSHGRLYVNYTPKPNEGFRLEDGSLEAGIAAVPTKSATIFQKIGQVFGFWREHTVSLICTNRHGDTRIQKFSFLLNTGSLTKRVGDVAKAGFNKLITQKSQLDPKRLEFDFKNQDISGKDASVKKAMINLINSQPGWLTNLFVIKGASFTERLKAIQRITKNIEALTEFGQTNSYPLSSEVKENLEQQLKTQMSLTIVVLRQLDNHQLESNLKNFIIDNLPLEELVLANPKENFFKNVTRSTNSLHDIAVGMIRKNISVFLNAQGNDHLLPALKEALVEPNSNPPRLTKEASRWVKATQNLDEQQIKSLLKVIGNNFDDFPQDLCNLLVNSLPVDDQSDVYVKIQAYQIGKLFKERDNVLYTRAAKEKDTEINETLQKISNHVNCKGIINEALKNLTINGDKRYATYMLSRFAASGEHRDLITDLLKNDTNYTDFILKRHIEDTSPLHEIVTNLYQDLGFLARNAKSFNVDCLQGKERMSTIKEVKLALDRIIATIGIGQLTDIQKKQIYDVVTNIPEIFGDALSENMQILLKSMLELDVKNEGKLAKAFGKLANKSVYTNLKIASGKIEDFNYFRNIILHCPITDLVIRDGIIDELKNFIKDNHSRREWQDIIFDSAETNTVIRTALEEIIKELMIESPERIYLLPTSSNVLSRILADALSEGDETFFEKLTSSNPPDAFSNLIDRSLFIFFENLTQIADSKPLFSGGIIRALKYINDKLKPWRYGHYIVDTDQLRKLHQTGRPFEILSPEYSPRSQLCRDVTSKLEAIPNYIPDSDKFRFSLLIERYLRIGGFQR
jgi:hypothetical protein